MKVEVAKLQYGDSLCGELWRGVAEQPCSLPHKGRMFRRGAVAACDRCGRLYHLRPWHTEYGAVGGYRWYRVGKES